jgi:hypothetical protein
MKIIKIVTFLQETNALFLVWDKKKIAKFSLYTNKNKLKFFVIILPFKFGNFSFNNNPKILMPKIEKMFFKLTLLFTLCLFNQNLFPFPEIIWQSKNQFILILAKLLAHIYRTTLTYKSSIYKILIDKYILNLISFIHFYFCFYRNFYIYFSEF